jgi:sulfite reductase alpha subunit-like flavoprotein
MAQWSYALTLYQHLAVIFDSRKRLSTMTKREENVLVLYGSMRGTAENAANELFKQIPEKLRPEKLLGKEVEAVKAVPILMELDDFLEKGEWAGVVVIFASSYGVGEAPVGSKNFRKLCETWIKAYTDQPDKPKILEGMRFALCGLGGENESVSG